MSQLNDFLQSFENDKHKEIMTAVFKWVAETFPELETTIKWNQPMFTHHGTFIIAFSKSKQHFSIAPETKCMNAFNERINVAGYAQTNNLFRIKWTQEIDFNLLKDMIQYNIEDKINCTTFWRS
ncbi:iron chaperone [Staphylococcus casei]|uniref:iron chaperone n=1 Tax=Staphylococcus TaxID=1279 RepID=UPI000CD21590|nr:DUF1801 domain-containing protein [Staphylococcus casei]PNZ61657.1 iron chaperone [Staphylococcus casei]PTI79523.1 iron chaperone [Staphylococcus succinus]WJE86148.1 DUF1801 domain-containing protein [Staphylococcus casei]